MTPFLAFMLWILACWVLASRRRPLQPDQPTDELSDVDLSDVHRQRGLQEAAWLDRPVVNVKLSRRRC